jgi:multiple sugar transport system ATP-binding protein
MAGVRFEHVTKRFGEVLAADEFSLEIADGEFLVLVGPSGCGKSTVLRLLAGLEELTEGDIWIGERRVNEVAAKDRDIAMVFQTYALYPHMSVFENMAFSLKLRKVERAEVERRVREAAQVLGLEELLERKPGQLSGGQRQRVALGRAIVRDPAAFLLDEPLSNLDAKLRVQTRAQIRQLHERLGATFIYVTHDQTEAMTMASRIAVMDQGRLQQVGSPQELYDEPANRFVAGFIGSPAMNLFETELRREGDSLQLDGPGFSFEAPEHLGAVLAEIEGDAVTLGLRPEHIHVPEFTPSGVDTVEVEVEVEVVEPMGNETVLHLRSTGVAVVARVDCRTVLRGGEETRVVFDRAQLHAFDAVSGDALAGAGSAGEAGGAA